MLTFHIRRASSSNICPSASVVTYIWSIYISRSRILTLLSKRSNVKEHGQIFDIPIFIFQSLPVLVMSEVISTQAGKLDKYSIWTRQQSVLLGDPFHW